jgi:hypothetical protein
LVISIWIRNRQGIVQEAEAQLRAAVELELKAIPTDLERRAGLLG